jgi:hypothetical protein
MFPTENKSFVQVVSNAIVGQHESPCLVIKGDSLCIKITQHVYEPGLADSQLKQLVLNKGDKSYTSKEVSLKL